MGEGTDQIGPRDEFEDPVIRRSSVSRVSGVSHEEAGSDNPETARIRSNIEHTRADLSETINALQDKLDPSRIAEQVKDQIREKATEAYDTAKQAVKEATIGKAEKIMSNVSETVTDMTGRAGTAVKDTSSSFMHYVRENPVSFALVGIGLGMLAMTSRRKEHSSYNTGRANDYPSSYSYPASGSTSTDQPSITDRARNLASGVADTAREATEHATGTVSSAAGSVRDAASSAVDTTRKQFQHVSDVAGERYNNMLQENPMALGIAALAAGAIVGLTLPTTRIEGEYMGEAREHLVDQAKSAAQETVEKIQRVAGEAGHSLKEAAQKEGLVTGS
jgi:ElaB/YqjD/DUF883 family membrane-anchored ribosome-binding protein